MGCHLSTDREEDEAVLDDASAQAPAPAVVHKAPLVPDGMAYPAPAVGADAALVRDGVAAPASDDGTKVAFPRDSLHLDPAHEPVWDGIGINNGFGVFINEDERDLFLNWVQTPHPELPGLRIQCYLHFAGEVIDPHMIPIIQAQVAATITKEQEWRFSRYAEHTDINLILWGLENLKQKLVEIAAVLETERDDTMAPFDAEDFARNEREDRLDRDADLKRIANGENNDNDDEDDDIGPNPYAY